MAYNNNQQSYAYNNQFREEVKHAPSGAPRINNAASPSPVPLKSRNDAPIEDSDNNNRSPSNQKPVKPAGSPGDWAEGRSSIAHIAPHESITGDKELDVALRYATEQGYELAIEKDEESEINFHQRVSVMCVLGSGSNAKEVQLLFDTMNKLKLPEIIICDERIAATPGFLDRVGFPRMKAEWNPSDKKTLVRLLSNVKKGINSLNQLEFEKKLNGLLAEQVISTYLDGPAIVKAVSAIRAVAAANKLGPIGVSVNVAEFEKNLQHVRHYINSRQDSRTLQLFQMLYTLDYADPEKQLQVAVVFFSHTFEIRLKPSVTKPSDKFNQAFCYDFMQAVGLSGEDYSHLPKKLQTIKDRFNALCEGSRFRKKFLNKLLTHICDYGVLYDIDIQEGYKVTILVKIKNNKHLLINIVLGDLFPQDVVRVVTKKFQEVASNNFTHVYNFAQRKSFVYEANGQKVRNFVDEELHSSQAADILQFVKEVIYDQNRQESYIGGSSFL